MASDKATDSKEPIFHFFDNAAVPVAPTPGGKP